MAAPHQSWTAKAPRKRQLRSSASRQRKRRTRQQTTPRRRRVDWRPQHPFRCRTVSSLRTLTSPSKLTSSRWEGESSEELETLWTIPWEARAPLSREWEDHQALWIAPTSESLREFSQQLEMVTPLRSAKTDLCSFLEEIDITCHSTTFTWWNWTEII